MSIPSYQDFMLPVLKKAATGSVHISDVIKSIAEEMQLSDKERRLTIPSGRSLLYERVSWAKTYLMQAGLLERTGRGSFKISQDGKALLAKKLDRVDNKILADYSSFQDFLKRGKKDSEKSEKFNKYVGAEELSPEESIHQSLEKIKAALSEELIRRILKANPSFFESLIIKLLVEMGYSNNTEEAWEHSGKSGDEGIDGIINQDVLGVDKIYIQAKRYANHHSVTSTDLRNFIGALDMCRAVKGVFVTTSGFTTEAKKTVRKSSKNIVLIDGKKLTELMIKYGVGCKTKETIRIPKIDEDFYEEM